MRKTSLIALLPAVALFSHAAFAAKPSFNCAKAEHEVETLICKDAELAKLDVSLTNLYNTLLKNTPASSKRGLQAEQSGWVKGRNDCWKSGDQRACVKAEYESRIKDR